MSSTRTPIVTVTPVAILGLALVGAVWGGLKLAAPTLQRGIHDVGAVPRQIDPRAVMAADEQAQIDLFRAASPSVCHITTRALAMDRFQMRATEVPRGTGSGFVWDARGYIVTNFHVIAGANSAYVTLDSQEIYEAKLVGADPSFDIAVLKIDPPAGLRALALGKSSDLQVGQNSFAIGNPFGLDHTLSTGVVSGLDREIESPNGNAIRGVIQTDAAINPGNSGGPLLDSSGRLIGMNTAIASPSGANAGIGFAVPVDTINRVVPRLIQKGAFSPPRLGIRAAPAEVSRALKVDGVVVGGVEPGLGAEEAGLRPLRLDSRGVPTGLDVITAVEGQRVRSLGELLEALSLHDAGETVDVQLLRDGKQELVRVRLSGGT